MAEPVAGPEVMSPLGVDGVLVWARAGAGRCTPQEVVAATRRGSLLVDTRTETQRHEQGELPGALVIDRTVLEWRLDPASAYRIPEATPDTTSRSWWSARRAPAPVSPQPACERSACSGPST